ncbi:MAG: hypothetical protein EBX36_13415, partial [Planctomycetia bacterium]|nr:hypothetical protein [Planctomycetia bacterium]
MWRSGWPWPPPTCPAPGSPSSDGWGRCRRGAAAGISGGCLPTCGCRGRPIRPPRSDWPRGP